MPTFDNKTEEGIRFRVYSFGNLEVRTTQQSDLGSKEVIGVVFSSEPAAAKIANLGQHDFSKLVKITEYVEFANDGRHSYLVFECNNGCTFLTEKLASGKATWEENPSGLEAR